MSDILEKTEIEKSTLLILNKDGGWADDDDEDLETEDSTTKKAWGSIEKPDVAPIGTDFKIERSLEESNRQREVQQQRSMDSGFRNGGFQDGGRRNYDGRRREFQGNRREFQGERREFQGERRDYQGGDRRDYHGGDRRDYHGGDRRDSGFKPFGEREGRKNIFGKPRRDNYGGGDPRFKRDEEPRERKPLNLAPRTVGTNDSREVRKSGESPFGDATPKDITVDTTRTSNVSEISNPKESLFGQKKFQPRNTGDVQKKTRHTQTEQTGGSSGWHTNKTSSGGNKRHQRTETPKAEDSLNTVNSFSMLAEES